MGNIDRKFLKKEYKRLAVLPYSRTVLDIVDGEGCSGAYQKEYWFKSDKKVGRKGRK